MESKNLKTGEVVPSSKEYLIVLSKNDELQLINWRRTIQDHLNVYIEITCKSCSKKAIKNMARKKDKYCNLQFLSFCRACSIKSSVKNKYGVDNVFQLQDTKEKSEKTCFKKYGAKSYKESNEGKEAFKQYSLNRYGTENPFQAEEVKNKIRETCIKKYGEESPVKTELVRDKQASTMIEKYGVAHALQNEECLHKAQRTMIERFGTCNINTVPEIIDKRRKTSLERYGVENPAQSAEIRQKMKQTSLKIYGVENPIKSQIVRDKIRRTNIERYGCEHPTRRRFYFDGFAFDSSWELYFYIYKKDKNFNIIREPGKIEYYVNDKQYYYYPDFEINGQLYEIKGDHFFDETGQLINPYSTEIDEDKMAAKFLCMKCHNVIILKKADLKDCFEYVDLKYGKDYINNIIGRKLNEN